MPVSFAPIHNIIGGCTEGDVRLVRDEEYNNMDNEREGRLEICVSGYWATYCSRDWTAWDTAAACRNLGFETLGKQWIIFD